MNSSALQYEVERSPRRRTASIQVQPGRVRVRVPAWVDDAWIAEWVESKRVWIARKQSALEVQTECYGIQIGQGAWLPYLGQELRLEIEAAARSSVTQQGEVLQVALSRRGQRPQDERAAEAVRGWYQAEAEAFLPGRLEHWQTVTGLRASGLKIKGFRRRWGSCDHKGGIALNWRLIMAPPHLVDYVVVHELAHLQHFDHSPRFWALVGQYLPEYRAHRAALRARHPLLVF